MSRRDERGVQFDMVDSIIRITAYKALMPIVQLAYVGRLGVTALAGATVALSVANLTGFLAMVGVSSSCSGRLFVAVVLVVGGCSTAHRVRPVRATPQSCVALSGCWYSDLHRTRACVWVEG
jgi:hypothetical protein